MAQGKKPRPDWLTAGEAAARLGLPEAEVRRLFEQGVLTGKRYGAAGVAVELTSLERFSTVLSIAEAQTRSVAAEAQAQIKQVRAEVSKLRRSLAAVERKVTLRRGRPKALHDCSRVVALHAAGFSARKISETLCVSLRTVYSTLATHRPLFKKPGGMPDEELALLDSIALGMGRKPFGKLAPEHQEIVRGIAKRMSPSN
jgi:hypothetical protein